VLVVTPELGALQNAYGFAKAALYRELLRLPADEHETELFQRSRESRTRLVEVLEDVAKERPELAATSRRHVAAFGACVVGNQLLEARDANVPRALERLLGDFLGLTAPVIGALRASRPIRASIQRRRPFLLDHATEESARSLREAARWLLSVDVAALRQRRDDADDAAARLPELDLSTPEPEALTHLRRSPREPVDLAAQLVVDGQLCLARLRDLSDGGALVESPAELTPLQTVLLAVPSLWHGLRPVEVRHAQPGRCGVRFLD